MNDAMLYFFNHRLHTQDMGLYRQSRVWPAYPLKLLTDWASLANNHYTFIEYVV